MIITKRKRKAGAFFQAFLAVNTNQKVKNEDEEINPILFQSL